MSAAAYEALVRSLIVESESQTTAAFNLLVEARSLRVLLNHALDLLAETEKQRASAQERFELALVENRALRAALKAEEKDEHRLYIKEGVEP